MDCIYSRRMRSGFVMSYRHIYSLLQYKKTKLSKSSKEKDFVQWLILIIRAFFYSDGCKGILGELLKHTS